MEKAGNTGQKAGAANYYHEDELHILMGMILHRLPTSGDNWDLIVVNDHAKLWPFFRYSSLEARPS